MLALRTRPLEELQEHLANIRSLGQGLSISKMALAEWGKMMGKMVLTKDWFFGMFLGITGLPHFWTQLRGIPLLCDGF